MNTTPPDDAHKVQKSGAPLSDNQHADLHWLAHELHDGLLPWVVSAKMQVEMLLLKAEEDSTTERDLQSSLNCLNSALKDGRSLIGFLLNDAEYRCEDVVTRLAEHVTTMIPIARQNTQVLRFQPPTPTWTHLDPARAWAVYRFAQQGLQNAIQHAGPTEICVSLGWQDDLNNKCQYMKLTIEDRGVGFDPSEGDRPGHYGLQSLRQRARSCDGRLLIDAKVGQGCKLTLVFPA